MRVSSAMNSTDITKDIDGIPAGNVWMDFGPRAVIIKQVVPMRPEGTARHVLHDVAAEYRVAIRGWEVRLRRAR